MGTSFVLYQPTLSITELYNAIGKTKGELAAKKALKDFYKMVLGKSALKYRVYSADAFYLQTSLDFKTLLISLDEEDFIDRIKAKDAAFNIFHARDALPELLDR